jgi:hypothetical protein
VAGRISVDLARRQGASGLDCDDCDQSQFVEVAGVSAGKIKNPIATERLMKYWTEGKGAIKIGWGTDGSMRRCIFLLSKYFPKNPGGLCANLHHRATGEWPTEHGKAGIPS